MKAVVHQDVTGLEGVRIVDQEDRKPEAGEVKVRLKAAGLNHRDLFVPQRHNPEDPPVVIGSDGAGVVEAVGEGVNGIEKDSEVVINPGLGWEKNSPAPPKGFEILGLPDDGTFAQSIIIPAENIEPKPNHLSWEEAGVLPLGALTAYRALFTRGGIRPRQTLFIPGVGSGVATFLVQMAKAAGARVIVTSRSEEKRNRALELGADRAIDSNADWQAELENEEIDLVIDSVGAATWNRSLDVLQRGGTMVVFGASAGDEVQVNIREFFYGQYNLLGSTMGSAEEFREMLQFIEEHGIKPVIDQVFPLTDAKQAFQRLEAGEQFGKIGLAIE
ncbi:MAG TPA: zinc-binding dehydrogenase [Bacillales bacterium]|nr:zinc-binding dehydrogenase [Bacillales bacterium]